MSTPAAKRPRLAEPAGAVAGGGEPVGAVGGEPVGAAAAAAAPHAQPGGPGPRRQPLHILAVSDTHDLSLPDFLRVLPTSVPTDGGHRRADDGSPWGIDVLVHTGDFCTACGPRGIDGWFARQGIPVKLLVAGQCETGQAAQGPDSPERCVYCGVV